jgi:hypothetical protein
MKIVVSLRRVPYLALLVAALLGAPAHGAENCPGTQVTQLPYSDAGTFPPGNEFDPSVVDFSYCGFTDPITQNGADFVVEFPSGENPHFNCTLQASAPVMTVFGAGIQVCADPQQWLETFCYTVHVGTDIDVLEGFLFFGPSALVVDSLGGSGTTFTLECDGAFPVELRGVAIE